MDRLVVKITSGVYLEILLRDLVLSCRLLPEGEEKGREQVVDRLKSYLEGRGDPLFSFRDLSLEDYSERVVRVYRVLKEVAPFGSAVTYGELGGLVGEHPRFIAYCMRINRFPLLIPCHRVVGKGSLGGFSCGTEIKRRLLAFEASFRF